MDLKKQAISGMFWVFIDTFLLKGISFLGTILLARILSPEDFGLIAMISVIVVIGVIVVDSGLTSSLIRNVKNDSIDYSTVFYTNVFLSLILYLCFYLLAPIIADFYNQKTLISIIRIYSICFFCSGLSSVQTAILIKKMEFKKIAYLNIPGSILGILIGLLMGYYGFGVWSIVGMYVSTQLIQMLTLWIGSDWRPRLEFSKEKLKYHYSFGFKLFVSSMVTSVLSNIYNVVIGKFYSLKTTGYFDRANMLTQYPVTILTQIIGKVTFPLMSGIQEEKDRLREIFKKLVGFTFFVTAPVMIGFSAVSKPLIYLILGDDWLPAVPVIEILSIGGVFVTLQALNVNILKIYGRSDLILFAEILLKVVLVISVFIAYFFGFYAIVWCVTLNSFITLIANMYCSNKLVSFSMCEQFKIMFPILSASILMYVLIKGIQFYCVTMPPLYELLLLTISGSVFYFIFSYLFKIPSLFFLIEITRRKVFKN